jgi:ankyrin repeat protein
MYGTPEMLRILLEHGADPNLHNTSHPQAPLEFLLGKEYEYSIRMSGMPILVTKAERTEMVLALFKAGARQPFAGISVQDDPKTPIIAADYLAWEPLMTLTEGGEVVQAMLATGTKPAFEAGQTTPLAYAAWTGNLGGVIALKAIAPRILANRRDDTSASGSFDTWLDAAMYAMQAKNDAILEQLIVPGMPFGQIGPVYSRDVLPLVPRYQGCTDCTLFKHAVTTGQTKWVERLVELGVPVDQTTPDQPTALYVAMQSGDKSMVATLIRLGADPLIEQTQSRSGRARRSANAFEARSPFELALQNGDVDLVTAMLARMTAQQKAKLNQDEVSPFGVLLESRSPNGPPIAQLLLENGVTPAKLDPDILSVAIKRGRSSFAAYMIIKGAPVEPAAGIAAPEGDPESDRNARPLAEARQTYNDPPLVEAVRQGDMKLVGLLLAKGAHPNFAGGRGISAVSAAIREGNVAMLDRLLAAGGTLSDKQTRNSAGDKKADNLLDAAHDLHR